MSGDVKAVTQASLNEKFRPPEFVMPARIAIMMNTLFTLLSEIAVGCSVRSNASY